MITNPTCVPAHIDSPPSHCTPAHPVWCDFARCTADPASQADGYRPGVGGEHRSAPVPLNLTTAMWLSVRDGTAWLSQACAPWECAVFLCVQVGDLELSMSADYAEPLLNALVTLLAPTAPVEEVSR
jgi:hypothetical protein